MAIYKRCSNCHSDNKLTNRKCTRCSSSLRSCSYRVRVKRNDAWQTQSVSSLREAKEVEKVFLTSSPLQHNNAPQPNAPSNQPVIINNYYQTTVVQNPSVNLQNNNIYSDGFQVLPEKHNTVDFEAYYQSAKLKKKSYRNDLQYWHKHVKDNDYQTTQGIVSILSGMKDRGYAPATVKHVLTFIKRLYNWHIEVDLLPEGSNPASKIKLPKFDNRMSQPLSREEARSLLLFLSNHDNRQMAVITSLALLTGRRQGELLKLTHKDIDLTRGTMHCRDTKNGSNQSFPLSTHAIELLEEAHTFSPDGQLFKYSKDGFKTNWYRLRDKLVRINVISNPKFRFHDLRHTYATLLANSGVVDIYTLQKLMGHSDITLTQRYSHLMDSTMKQATGVLDSVL